MNFSEFRKRLGADPWNRDPETLRARNSGPEFKREAEASEAFERKLQAALEVPVDDRLASELVSLVESTRARRVPPRWLALAATVVLVVGAASVYWLQVRQPQDVHVYVARHLSHDGANLVASSASLASPERVQQTLARFGVTADAKLTEQVRLIKFCPTPDGKGAHMVLNTPDGPVHLIYMPETPVTDGEEFGFDGMLTHLVSLEKGSAAIVGHNPRQMALLDRLVRDSIQPIPSQT